MLKLEAVLARQPYIQNETCGARPLSAGEKFVGRGKELHTQAYGPNEVPYGIANPVVIIDDKYSGRTVVGASCRLGFFRGHLEPSRYTTTAGKANMRAKPAASMMDRRANRHVHSLSRLRCDATKLPSGTVAILSSSPCLAF
jgi:hypothetical protein